MRTIRHITLAILITIIIRRTWKPAAKWVFTRIPVETHPDCKPRYRTWKNGIEIVDNE